MIDMIRITFHLAKKEGEATVRYRLREGDDIIQITHRSDIRCDVKKLAKFKPTGEPKDRVTVYDVKLSALLKKEYEVMLQAYDTMCKEGLDMTSKVWEREIAAIKNPIQVVRAENPDIVSRFRRYANDALRDGIFGAKRHKHIIVVCDKLERFLIIQGRSCITAEEFNVDLLMGFRKFLFDEYLFVEKYPDLYKRVKKQNKPQKELSTNTVTSQLKMVQTFFNELEDADEIVKSPFRRIGREKKKAVMRTMYDLPIYLRKEELLRILNTTVPENLQDVKDAFMVQCALGFRVSEFALRNIHSVAVSEDGIPYVHYISIKTVKTLSVNEEVKTPLVRFAFDIIVRTGFNFPILRNIYGTYGYNAQIKALLQYCHIDREVALFNEKTKQNDYVPLYSVGCSKLARKTCVDMMNKVQVDMFAAGLHKIGSNAVTRYTNMELADTFRLMCAAFGQEEYHVDKDLNII